MNSIELSVLWKDIFDFSFNGGKVKENDTYHEKMLEKHLFGFGVHLQNYIHEKPWQTENIFDNFNFWDLVLTNK